CKKTAERLEQKIQPLFGGTLRIVFHHYPLHKACNVSTRSSMHPNACEAARWAEATRILKGNGGFWEAHDYLFENQSLLKHGELAMTAFANAMDLPMEDLQRAISSEVVSQRITDDTKLGGTVGVRATPSVFLQGRLLHTMANQSMAFWDAAADRYWTETGQKRPAQTQRPTPEKKKTVPKFNPDKTTPTP
ncbi:MAG: DsbA family protein, partial [Phycisphaerae bacterium]